jgi:serine/threonine-protein kinase
MADVFEAINDHIGKRVAVKILRPELSQNEEFKCRFLNEARAVNLIHHPGLVSIFEYGRTIDGCAYLVMEHLDGPSLGTYIRNNSPLPIKKCLSFVQHIASVLSAAHAAGVIHRDLKPDNIIVVKDPDMPGEERIKLFDFGIAKMEIVSSFHGSHNEATLTKAGAVFGTIESFTTVPT